MPPKDSMLAKWHSWLDRLLTFQKVLLALFVSRWKVGSVSYEVGDEITMEGRNTIIWHEASEGHFMCHPPIAKSHHAACYACYHHYIYTASTWIRGAGCVRIPTCVENNIRCLFPGDGVFVGCCCWQCKCCGSQWC